MRDLKRDIIVGEDRTCGSVLTDGDRDGTPRAQLKQFCQPDCWLPVANTLKHANTHIHTVNKDKGNCGHSGKIKIPSAVTHRHRKHNPFSKTVPCEMTPD